MTNSGPFERSEGPLRFKRFIPETLPPRHPNQTRSSRPENRVLRGARSIAAAGTPEPSEPSNDPSDPGRAQHETGQPETREAGRRSSHREFDEMGRFDMAPGQRDGDQNGRVDDVG